MLLLLLSLLGLLLLLLRPEQCGVLVRACCCRDAIGDAVLTSCPCSRVHGILPLGSHSPREMLCCELSGLLRRQIWILCPELLLKVIDLIGQRRRNLHL